MSANKERPLESDDPDVGSRSHLRSQGSNPQRYHGSKAWWSVGEYLHQGITHQSVGLTLTDDDTWDLQDSLADLYQAVTQQKQKAAVTKVRGHHTRKGSAGTASRVDSEKRLDIQRWLDDDTSHGFIRVFASDSDTQSRLFPCTLSTHAQKICLLLGIPGNALHVQLSGHVIKRMEPFDCPLAIQNEYLAGLGYSDMRYIQQEGPSEDLTYLVRFYAGKPLSDYTYTRNQLTTYAYVRKGKLLHQWARRMCVISGTTLLVYRDKESDPTSIQLAKGCVEEVQVKGQSLVLKITSTLEGEKSIFISYVSQDDYNKWLKKLRKATAKLPSKADLSNCHLEFLPETVFINTELQILTLRHNVLRERPVEEDIYTIGWLDDLPRFTLLRSLNLADNQLNSFPMSLCSIRSLVELNLASNKLMEVPSQISQLFNLQVLHLHNNLLHSLPDEISTMCRLAVIVLAFNRFVSIPSVLTHSVNKASTLDSIIMAGNQVTRIPPDLLTHLGHVKKIDLRLNRLRLLPTETAKLQNLEHITHLDIRENEVVDLDIRAIRCLEYINCERNNMRSMQVNGSSLKNVFASKNNLHTLSISPKPEWLISMDVSHNKLTELPDWLSDCFFLVHLDVSHNHIKALPERLFKDAPKLKIVKANHNRMTALPAQIRSESLEELHLQHNQLRHLPPGLFIKAKRLRYLNVTRNKLCDLPPPNENDSYNKLQELYLSFNHLGNSALDKICCFPRLRVLHMARNKLTAMAEIDLEKLEQLTEINISSNNLTYLPSSLGRHPKLQILRTNCNLLQELPNFKNSSALKVLEASSNLLVNVNMANLMASQVSLLDISANPNILVKAQELQAARNSKQLCMVDMRGQNRSLEDIRSEDEERLKGLWQTGLSQTSGIRNKLCVSTLSKPQFGDAGEALFGIFDGGRNDIVAEMLCDVMPTVLKEERVRSKKPEVYLKYSMLSAHRNLKSHGQKLGASSVIAFLHVDEKGQNVLSVANVGDGQAVLCRQKKALVLSRAFVASENREDTNRVINAGGIITEDGRVSGVTYNTRLLGSSYLYPYVIPEPHVSSTVLTHDDTFFILGSQGLWQYVSHEEAIREVKEVADPIIAAKRLQDLAQGLGSRENMAVLVVRLMLSRDEKTKMADLIKHQKSAQKELFKILSHENKQLHHLRDGVPKDAKIDDIVISKSGHVKKHKTSRKRLSEASSSEKSLPSPDDDVTSNIHRREALKELQKATFNYSPNETSNSEYESTLEKDDSWKEKHNLYRKKTDAVTELQRRIAKDLKTNELKNLFEKELKTNDLMSNTDSSDDSDIFVSGSNSSVNWSAVRSKKTRAENPESQLKERIGQELIEKELKTAVEATHHVSDNEEEDQHNWLTVSNQKEFHSPKEKRHGALSSPVNRARGITLPTGIKGEKMTPFEPGSTSESKVSLHSDILNMMSRSSHSHVGHPEPFLDYGQEVEGYDLSPGESVSSIDLRLHDEVEEIYRLRHAPNPTFSHDSGLLPQLDKNVADALIPRSLSPDSLISLDEFVKPPISNANIDRDALLFHQMQMARAQAHSGSSASLDTVQSAPLNPPDKELQSNVRASSHSIEVLVNIGVDKEEVKQGSLPLSLEHVTVDVSGSSSTLTSRDDITRESLHNLKGEKLLSSGGKYLKTNKLRKADSVGNLYSLEDGGENTEKARGIHNVDGDGDASDQDDNDDDRDTIVGDADDIANDFEIEYQSSGDMINHVQNAEYPNVDDGDEEDSDSEGSIGNVSLEDGYTAFDFQKQDKTTSLSMMNVLDDEEDIYPKDTGDNSVGKPEDSDVILQNGGHERDSLSVSAIDDYDDISDGSNVGVVDDDNDEDDDHDVDNKDMNYTDDSNPYEDIHIEPEEMLTVASLLNGHSPPHERDECESPSRLDVPTEGDIDNLYARVNKIKMKKILDRVEEEDSMSPPLDPLLPSIESISYPPSLSHQSLVNSQTGVILFKDDNDIDDDPGDENGEEEREIFITASNFINYRSPPPPPPPPHPPSTPRSKHSTITHNPPISNTTSITVRTTSLPAKNIISLSTPIKLKSKPAPFPPPPSPPHIIPQPHLKPTSSHLTNGHQTSQHQTPSFTNHQHNVQPGKTTFSTRSPTHRPTSPPPPPVRPPIPPRQPIAPLPRPPARNPPTPIDMQPASRQLPTQRSIIITYL